jgi:hypothetical protein
VIIADLVFLTLVIVLPVLVAWRIFTNEPSGRSFMVSWGLAIVGTQMLAAVFAFGLLLFGIDPIGMFGGFLILPMSVAAATGIGIFARWRRLRTESLNNAPNP